MLTKDEIRELNKDIIKAIDWVAAEYKYIIDLKKELNKIQLNESKFNIS